MNTRMLCCIAWLSLASACAVATSPDMGAQDPDTGAGGAARGGTSAFGGAGRASGNTAGAAAIGGAGAGNVSGTGNAGAAQAGGAHGGQAGSASGGRGGGAQGGSAQGGSAQGGSAGSAGATSPSCSPHVFAWADAQHTLKSVAVTGSFNAWSTTGSALTYDAAAHRWTLSLTVAAGMHQYKFILDGSSEWKADPASSNTVPDGFGGVNSVLDCQ